MNKKRILLVNFGGPRYETDIPCFLKNLIGRQPVPSMAENVMNRYRLIGGCSPLPSTTEKLAELLTVRLGPLLDVKAAFLYSSPSIDERIDECLSSGVREICFFILSPYYSSKITGSYIHAANTALARRIGYNPSISFIHSWYAAPSFIEWWAGEIKETLEKFRDPFFVFSAHSLPLSGAEDSYRSQVEETVRLVARKASLSSYSLAWQSASPKGQEKWLEPFVEQTFASLKQQGVNLVVQVPIGFIMDHLETLYDIDILHKDYAIASGMSHHRLACPNLAPDFLDCLSAIVSSYVKDGR